jgi:hypothetical protein
MADLIAQLAAESQRIEEDTEFSAKGHYNAAIWWRRCHRSIGIAATIFSGLTAVAALKELAPAVIAVASVIAGLLTGILTFLKPSEEADRHHRAGDKSLVVRNRARFFRNVTLAANDLEGPALIADLQRIADERHAVFASAPVIPPAAYHKAKAGIEQQGESKHRVDS